MKISTNKIFFSSDPHFFHSNVIKYCNRPFTNAEEMNDTLVTNWNTTVPDNAIVFLLGDVSFAKPDQTEKILKQLNGNIYLIRGNHDWNLRGLSKYFVSEKDYMEIEVPDDEVKGGYMPITLCHFPMITWNKAHYGAIQLFGHVHERWLGNNKQINVGVDVWDFKPCTYQQIKERLKTLPPKQNFF